MLTKVRAYSTWKSAPTLLLAEDGRAETDLIQVRNIDGLDPVKAAINTSEFGSIDGVAFTGADVLARNIVLTLHPNPDWDTWTHDTLRRLIYRYFTPKQLVKLDFYSDDDFPPVGISGYVESIEANPFSKDPEFQVSIVCPDPYFTALDPTELIGISASTLPNQAVNVQYDGDIEIGFNLVVDRSVNPLPEPTWVLIQSEEQVQTGATYFWVYTDINLTKYLVMNSVPGQKYIQSISRDTGVVENLLSSRIDGSSWPTLKPGLNKLLVATDTAGNENWKLTYYARYGGL